MHLKSIPVGTIIHNVEMKEGKGGQLARAAGTYVQLVGKDGGYAQVKLRSGELRHGARRMPGHHRRGVATPTTRTSSSARPAVRAGWAFARACAAWR